MKLLITLVAALGLAGSAIAMDTPALGVDIGTTGAGAHLTVPISKTLNTRVGFGYGTYSYSGTTSDLSYDFKLKTNTVDALLDWHPFSGSFRLTGGVVYNNNKIDASAKPNAGGTYTLQGNTYSADAVGQIDSKIDFRKVAPYIGFGFGNAVAADETGLSFGSDFGVIYSGSPRTALTNTGCVASAATCSQLATDLVSENEKLAKEVRDFKAYPVIRLSVNYRF